MKTILVVLVATLSASIGESILSFGMRKIGACEPSARAWFVMVATNPYVYVGVVFLACFFFLYLLALSWADLSFVLPITALSYLFAGIFAKYLLHEQVSWVRWAGIMIIVLGIVLIAAEGGKQRTSQITCRAFRVMGDQPEGR